MPAIAKASIGKEPYLTRIRLGEHALSADELPEDGGGGKGPSPMQLLASSLAGCTAITLRVYLSRKDWYVPEIQVVVSMESEEGLFSTNFDVKISFPGAELDEDKRKRLLAIANKCPVHKLLSGELTFNTALEGD